MVRYQKWIGCFLIVTWSLLLAGCTVKKQEAIDNITATVEEQQTKKETVDSKSEEEMQKDIPLFISEKGFFEGTYYCGSDNYQESYLGVTIGDVERYQELLGMSGYIRYSENKITDNLFATYVKGDKVIWLLWYPSQSRFNIVHGPYTYLPDTEVAEYTELVVPSVAQIGRDGSFKDAPGLLLVFQLADGSYVIIDGGPDFGSDEKILLEYLIANNPLNGKPRVTWMFTHAHGDHVDLAMNFLIKHYKEIELDMVCYNFPDYSELAMSEKNVEAAEGKVAMLQNVIKKKFPKTKIYNFHTGEKLLLPGCEIEFLKTHEDFWPNEIKDMNETCAAWRVSIEDKTTLILGDCLEKSGLWMSEVYGAELKTDILQITHHGFNGGCIELYQYADPEICFWPIDQHRFDDDDRLLGTLDTHKYNAWLRDDEVKIRTHFAASDTVTLYYPEMDEENGWEEGMQ